MRKILILIATAILCASLFLITGCNTVTEYDGIKVIYMLEGGTFQNGKDQVVHYYQFPEGGQKLIKPLQSFADSGDLTNPGFDFVGWFTKKSTDDAGNTVYSDEWQFDSDTVTEEGITLYASWKKQSKYTYDVYDYDTDAFVTSKEVSEGVPFVNRYATRLGYTLLALYDAEKQPWDETFKHPGGEGDVAIKVYAKYIVGTYAVVTSASELKTAISLKQNIYLANDIDFANVSDLDGKSKSLSFGDFRKEFLGNGHTISNFSIPYSANRADLIEDFEDSSKKSLAISLFGQTDGAKIKDVIFENVSVDISILAGYDNIYKIYFAPLSVSATNTEISNVTFSGNITVTSLPNQIAADQANRLIVKLTEAVCFKDDLTTVTGFTSELTYTPLNSEE